MEKLLGWMVAINDLTSDDPRPFQRERNQQDKRTVENGYLNRFGRNYRKAQPIMNCESPTLRPKENRDF
jgi:hypothetical protein